MQQLSAPLTDKMDEPLAELCDGGRGVLPSARVPVLVKCQPGALDEIGIRIESLGGSIRHHLQLVDAIAAWVPLVAVESIATDNRVYFLELEQSFTTA